VLEINKKHYGECHKEYTKTLDSLTNLFKEIGDFESAYKH
jgi:hypothetical protein